VIVDDVEYTSASKQRLKDLAILMRFASSHKNLSVIVSHQSFFRGDVFHGLVEQ
jgi:hypothetical protein